MDHEHRVVSRGDGLAPRERAWAQGDCSTPQTPITCKREARAMPSDLVFQSDTCTPLKATTGDWASSGKVCAVLPHRVTYTSRT